MEQILLSSEKLVTFWKKRGQSWREVLKQFISLENWKVCNKKNSKYVSYSVQQVKHKGIHASLSSLNIENTISFLFNETDILFLLEDTTSLDSNAKEKINKMYWWLCWSQTIWKSFRYFLRTNICTQQTCTYSNVSHCYWTFLWN